MTMLVALAICLQDPGAKPAFVAKTPEEAFRTLIVAMMSQDEPTVRAVVLSTDEVEWLLKGPPPPKAQVEAMKGQIEKMEIKALKAGDSYGLPGGKTAKVVAEEVGDDRAVLQPAGSPQPIRCRKVDGAWKVDAAPVIAGRKAADAARKKAAAKKAG